MAVLYPMREQSDAGSLHKERYSFVKALNRGLNSALSTCAVEDKVSLLPSPVSTPVPSAPLSVTTLILTSASH